MTSRHIPPSEPASAVVFDDTTSCREVWTEAVSNVPSPSPFATSVFQDGLERIVSWKRVVIQVPGAGMASVFIRSRGPVRDLVLPPFCPFTAVLPPSDESPLRPEQFLQPIPGIPENRLFSFDPSVSEEAIADAGLQRLEVIPRFTYHLSSAPLEAALAAWSSSQRRSFRNHDEEFRFSVVGSGQESSDDHTVTDISEVLSDLVALTEAGYKRHGRPLPLPSDGLTDWARELVQAGTGRLYVLHNVQSNDLEAGVLALHNERMAWYWLAGSRPGPAMTVLMAHMQDDLKKMSIPILDLMGANTPGIAEFKRRFGGEKIRYLHVLTSTPGGRLMDRLAHTLRRILP